MTYKANQSANRRLLFLSVTTGSSLLTASQILSWGSAISHFFVENAFIPRSIMVYCRCEVMA